MRRHGLVEGRSWMAAWLRLRGCSCMPRSFVHAVTSLPPSCRWGMFRDRRPDLYGPIATLDGSRNSRR